MLISFVILCWNSERYIKNCLDSIINIKQDNFVRHIIVVDNGSTDNSKSLIRTVIHVNSKDKFTTIELIELDKNYGTTFSRNIGIKHILNNYPDTEYYCILDSDTIINYTAMETMGKLFEEDATCGIIGPRMRNSSGEYQVSCRNIPTLTEKILKVIPVKSLQKKGDQMQVVAFDKNSNIYNVGYLMSACWLVRAEVIDKIGLLDEKIFYAPEDVEYCVRCWKAGYTVKYCAGTEIIHEWQRLSRKKIFSKHNFEHMKGLLYFYVKHGHAFKQYCPYKLV